MVCSVVKRFKILKQKILKQKIQLLLFGYSHWLLILLNVIYSHSLQSRLESIRVTESVELSGCVHEAVSVVANHLKPGEMVRALIVWACALLYQKT